MCSQLKSLENFSPTVISAKPTKVKQLVSGNSLNMKIKVESSGKSVCKAVAYMQTRRFGFKGNIHKLIAFTIENIQLSLIPQVSNPNFNDDKVVFSTLSDPIVLGVYEVMSESEGNLTIRV